MTLGKKDFIFLVIFASIISLFGILSNPNIKTSAQDEQCSVKNETLYDHDCNSSEWHFVIKMLDDVSCAPNIEVTWENRGTKSVSLDSSPSEVCHYTTDSNLNSMITEATTDICQFHHFNLSHGPCFTPTPSLTEPTNTPTGTITPEPTCSSCPTCPPCPSCSPYPTLSPHPTCPTCPPCPSGPTCKPSESPTPSEPEDTPIPTEEVTPEPTPEESPTPEPSPEETPTQTPTPKEEEENGDEGDNGENGGGGEEPTSNPTNPVVAGIMTTTAPGRGGVSEENPLVEGIQKAFGRVLGEDSVPDTDGEDFGEENLPSGLIAKSGVSLVIPKLGLDKLIYEGEKLGDQYLAGDKEVMEVVKGNGYLIYGHNTADVLGRINQLSLGDRIIRRSGSGLEVYQVKSIARLSEGNPRVMETNENELVLLTCDLWQDGLRIIVKAKKI